MNQSWEAERRWEIVRYLVYYLQENFVPKEWVTNKDILDFSCGLGDLSLYLSEQNPKSVTSTVPENNQRPLYIKDQENINFINELEASKISSKIKASSIDLFVARMVFQFPTMEDHYIDVDGMLSQVYKILKPGGRVVICSHEYMELSDDPQLWNLPTEEYLNKVVECAPAALRQKIKDYVEFIETIGLPPREGVHGQTGFGLKSLMCVDSFIKAGFQIESCGHLEDFTFPRGLKKALEGEALEEFKALSGKVFSSKKKKILSEAFKDKYKRPRVLQEVLKEISQWHSFVSIPIFRIVAQKPTK